MNVLKTAVFDAFGKEEVLKPGFRRVLNEGALQTSWFDLPAMSIQPCRSCGSCGFRSPGQCVIPDDMQAVLKAFAAAQVIVFLTPIRFGGYSFDLKKAVDRLLPVGLPYYVVKGGRMLHPMRYGQKLLIAVGLSTDGCQSAESNFKNLVKANGINLLSKSRSFVFGSLDSAEKLAEELAHTLAEVKRQ